MRGPGTAIEIVWQSWFEVGHERIDSEHRTFFDIIKSIDEDLRAGNDHMRILRTLNELKLYTEFHFASEENLMEDVHYPHVRSHREGHKAILAEMDEYIRDTRLGIDRTNELLTFLFNWFCSHTVNEDSKFSRYVASGKS